jgi:hypothetical protein
MKKKLTIHKFSKSLFFCCFLLATMLLIYRKGRGVPESGKSSKPEEPARKPQTVREYHRAHEAEILPYVRRVLYLLGSVVELMIKLII